MRLCFGSVLHTPPHIHEAAKQSRLEAAKEAKEQAKKKQEKQKNKRVDHMVTATPGKRMRMNKKGPVPESPETPHKVQEGGQEAGIQRGLVLISRENIQAQTNESILNMTDFGNIGPLVVLFLFQFHSALGCSMPIPDWLHFCLSFCILDRVVH